MFANSAYLEMLTYLCFYECAEIIQKGNKFHVTLFRSDIIHTLPVRPFKQIIMLIVRYTSQNICFLTSIKWDNLHCIRNILYLIKYLRFAFVICKRLMCNKSYICVYVKYLYGLSERRHYRNVIARVLWDSVAHKRQIIH